MPALTLTLLGAMTIALDGEPVARLESDKVRAAGVGRGGMDRSERPGEALPAWRQNQAQLTPVLDKVIRSERSGEALPGLEVCAR